MEHTSVVTVFHK